MAFYKLYFNSPIGVLEILTDEDSLISLSIAVKKKRSSKVVPVILKETYKQLTEYFMGERLIFNLKLFLDGTEFQKRVWNELLNIPCGQVTTYKCVAEKIGNIKASRAVGNANNKNKILIIVPCHRVVGSDGKLNGYREGTNIKEWLINHEQHILKTL